MNVMAWAVTQQFGRQATSLLVLTVVAFLVGPSDFGLIAMSTVWLQFAAVFSELGFGAALVQRQHVSGKHFDTVFVVNVATGVLLTVLGVTLASPAAAFFHAPEVRSIMSVLSVSFLINSLSLTQTAVAQRHLRFKSLAIRDIVAALLGGLAGIVFAWLKFGVWSLVIQTLVTNTLSTVLIWSMSEWRPQVSGFSMACLRELWGYSSRMFAFSVLKYFVQNTDTLLVGHYLGAAPLGVYTFAFKVVVTPVSSLVGAVGNYLFVRFSRLQEDVTALSKYYLILNKMTTGIGVPVLVVLAWTVPLFGPVLGPKWIDAVSLMQVFTIVGLAQTLISPVGQFMKALNRPDWLLYWSMTFSVITSVSVWVGSRFGLLAVGIGLSAAHVIGVAATFWIASRLLPLKYTDILSGLIAPFGLGGLFIAPFIVLTATGLSRVIPGLMAATVVAGALYIYGLKHVEGDLYRQLLRRIIRA